MKLSNIQIGHTFHNVSGELSGVLDEKLLEAKYKYFAVKLSIMGNNTLNEFSDINKTFDYLNNHDLVFRFLELIGEDKSPDIFVLDRTIGSEKIVGYRNIYGIGEKWKLYINSKSDIVVQHIQFPNNKITARFVNFPLDKDFYIYLSCLIYTLKNQMFETESELKEIFKKVRDYATK